jgi:hypothetical protein
MVENALTAVVAAKEPMIASSIINFAGVTMRENEGVSSLGNSSSTVT